MTSINGLNPSNLSLISRYRIVNKEKIKIDLGIHLPAFRVDENQEYKSRIVQESNIIYSINSKTKLSLLYMHGEGRNFNFNVNFLTLNFQKTLSKFVLNSQLYVLNIDDIIGFAQSVYFKLNNKLNLKLFVNKSITTKKLNKTLGFQFKL